MPELSPKSPDNSGCSFITDREQLILLLFLFHIFMHYISISFINNNCKHYITYLKNPSG
ncbi:hypothetical protein CLOL250_02930 [Clostridium sp. L2-50]|nr:hypothetical protein CLOL250_02930 [Clostridium sp. L2-50]DAZ06137.1 MAG TPA: hypothetical protein [Caudoviricetes sp.]